MNQTEADKHYQRGYKVGYDRGRRELAQAISPAAGCFCKLTDDQLENRLRMHEYCLHNTPERKTELRTALTDEYTKLFEEQQRRGNRPLHGE